MLRLRTLAPRLAGLLLALTTHAAARDLVALSPATAAPGPGTPAAQAAPRRALLLPLPFEANAPDRFFWDLPLRPPGRAATAIAVELSCDDPAALRALTFHLQSGGQWLSAQKILETPGRQTLYLQPADFAAESGTPDWHAATTLRISAWKGAAPRATALTLHAVRPHAHAIAILRGTDLTAPGETALAAHCAARAQRLFEAAGLPAALLDDDIEQLDLRPYPLVVLPYNPRLTSRQLDALERHVKRRGRLAVFYSSNARLAKLLGFALLPYAASPEDWNSVDFIETAARGLPDSMPHITRHLLPVRANAKDAATLGRWYSPDGIPDHNLPAATVSPRGLWFSHIPPLASPSAIQWLLASLAAADPRQQSALDAHLAQARQRDAQAAAELASLPAPANEIRAAWALPIPDRLRERTLSALAGHRLNTLYEHLATGPFAHYRAGGDLPVSDLGQRRPRPYLARALESARTNHIALHAWVVCWSLDGLPDALLAPLRTQGRLMQDAHGNPLPWLCPVQPDNRAALLGLYADLARRGVAGLHLDYIRYPARDGCYCPRHRDALAAHLGQRIDNWPADVLPGGPRAAAYDQFRRDDLTAFVADVRRSLRDLNPDCIVSAAVYPTPESAADNAQDWPRWLADGHLDYAAPMLYARDPARFADLVRHAIAAAPSPGKILPGIGTGADEAQLDALATARQIRATRQAHTAGFALFQLDSDLLTRILPPLAPAP